MAIDTAAKRASAACAGFIPNLFIIPDGVIDQGNRQTLGDIYSGILSGILDVLPTIDNTLSFESTTPGLTIVSNTPKVTV